MTADALVALAMLLAFLAGVCFGGVLAILTMNHRNGIPTNRG